MQRLCRCRITNNSIFSGLNPFPPRPGHGPVSSSCRRLANVRSSSRPTSVVVPVFFSGGVFVSDYVSNFVRHSRDCISSSLRLSVSPPNRPVAAA
ncbi:hypothetical protein SESBI_48528 [Sesbania bispinosa]|nr:hypothetical protein SESBI_48528 [Sesbania bispinosa]